MFEDELIWRGERRRGRRGRGRGRRRGRGRARRRGRRRGRRAREGWREERCDRMRSGCECLDASRAVGHSNSVQQPTLTRATRIQWAILGIVVTAVCVAGGAVLFFCDPDRVGIYPVCYFHELTGLDCPGCGGLRAMHQFLHGHLAAALHYNAFAVISLPVLAIVALRAGWIELGPRRKSDSSGRPRVTVRPLWVWVYLGLWLAFTVCRNLPYPLFASFAP